MRAREKLSRARGRSVRRFRSPAAPDDGGNAVAGAPELARANSHGLNRVVAVTQPVPARLRQLRLNARVGGARADPNFATSLDTCYQPPTRPGVARRLSEDIGLGPVSVAERNIDSNDRTASGPGQTLDGQVAGFDRNSLF